MTLFLLRRLVERRRVSTRVLIKGDILTRRRGLDFHLLVCYIVVLRRGFYHYGRLRNGEVCQRGDDCDRDAIGPPRARVKSFVSEGLGFGSGESFASIWAFF